MKKYLFVMLSVLLFGSACSDDENSGYKTYQLAVQVAYPSGCDWSLDGLAVKLTDSNGTIYDGTTDAAGKADFTVPVGIYEASVSNKRASEGYAYMYNGIKSGIMVTDQWASGTSIALDLTESKAGQVIIKELYVGGCQTDNGSGKYQYDQYVILYNNSDQVATLDNLCLGYASPSNEHSSLNDYVDGELAYAQDGFIPALWAVWYFPQSVELEPYSQIVVALNGAINHTLTYSNSVDLSQADYCAYDMDVFTMTNAYPAPSETIPTSHYLSAYKYNTKLTGWGLSISSPAFFIFTTQETAPASYVSNVDHYYYYSNKAGKEGNETYCCVKVPTDWILDGIEVFSQDNLAASKKRLTAAVDGGYTPLTNYQGHTSYRNVDKEATEALEGNTGKLVYNDTEDANGMDAEASIKNGARIVYQDTNNSTTDFHQRSRASLRN